MLIHIDINHYVH